MVFANIIGAIRFSYPPLLLESITVLFIALGVFTVVFLPIISASAVLGMFTAIGSVSHLIYIKKYLVEAKRRNITAKKLYLFNK